MPPELIEFSQGPRPTPDLLRIPEELRQTIVGYVTARTDLKSLCLTSSALRVLANPLLYRRINLRLWSQPAVDRFRYCNLYGAGPHLQHTKELIIEDQSISEEPGSIHTGRIRPTVVSRGEPPRFPNDTQRDNDAYYFLQIMHHHSLERLCYLSQRPLSMLVKMHLRDYQTKIQDLQVSLYTDPGSPGLLPRVFCGLQRLDLYLTESTDIALLFDNIQAVGANLKRLSLVASESFTITRQLDAWAMGETHDLTRYTSRLTELRLANFEFERMFDRLRRVIDFHRLVRLELLTDLLGTHQFIQGLADSANNKRFQLKHIALEYEEHEFEEDTFPDAAFEESMIRFFRACEPIESFHLHYPNPNVDPVFFLAIIDRMTQHNLQSLSLQCDLNASPELDEHRLALLEWVSNSSLNRVKQLAFQFGEAAMLNSTGDYPLFLQSLQRFPQLRLLHLSETSTFRLGRSLYQISLPPGQTELDIDEWPSWDPSILTLQLQTFANQLFGDMHEGGHSRLDALVVGHVARARNTGRFPLQQQCFVKGEQRDILGRTVAVGVPVTRMMLRECQPYTDILDIDKSKTGDAYDVWAGRAM